MKAVDLHVHSNFSDGSDSPSEIVKKALSKNLSAIALTDHDTIEGIEEITKCAAGTGLEIIPGIELSTEYNGKDVHILGLYINIYNSEFLKSLVSFRDSREARNEKMCANLREMGIDITMDELRKANPDCVITRSHFGDYLLSKGFVSTKKEAFERYIGDHCKAFVPREKITPEMGVSLIKKAGGIAVLAHPILYKLSKPNLEILISTLKDAGLDGIEAVYSEYTPADERLIKQFANKYNLLLTGGSDYHGTAKKDIDLGTGRGHLFVPEEFVSELKNFYLKNFPTECSAKESTLVFDLDGSLLNDEKIITPKTYSALKASVEKGYLFVISTGRPLSSVLNLVEKLNLTDLSPVISAFNGGIIYDCKSKETTYKSTLSPEIAEGLREIGLRLGVHYHSYTATEVISEKDDEEISFYSNTIKIPYVVKENCNDENSDVYKYLFMHLTDKKVLENVAEEINKKYGDKVLCLFSNDKFLEVLPSGSGKGQALLKICSLTGRKTTGTYTFADAGNDVSMFEVSARSIALFNAFPEAKACADYITFTDNNHDGLAPFLNCL